MKKTTTYILNLNISIQQMSCKMNMIPLNPFRYTIHTTALCKRSSISSKQFTEIKLFLKTFQVSPSDICPFGLCYLFTSLDC